MIVFMVLCSLSLGGYRNQAINDAVEAAKYVVRCAGVQGAHYGVQYYLNAL